MSKLLATSHESLPTASMASVPPPAEQLLQDMEYIGYVAGHDLMGPVRSIISSVEQMKDTPQETKETELQAIAMEASRLRAMLQGLQEYVRLESFPVKHTSVDSKELVQASMDALAEEIRNSGAVISCDSLPAIMGHRGRLTRLFACLIDNAVKFHSGQPPRIHIAARRAEDMWEFCVEDNGIGIEEDFHEIIFRLFQRTHTNEDYPGYGIGLTLAQKIVLSHGGRLWLESTPGEGSRFYFTLPATEVNGG